VLASAVAPFWHWAFLPVGVGGDVSIYKDFIAGTIRWLTISDESDRINFRPGKEVFQSGEEVVFEGTVHDEGFRPIADAVGDLTIWSEDNDTTLARIVPDPNKAGKYYSHVGIIPPGTYNYKAELQAESVRLGQFEGKFAVDEIDRETALTEVDWTNLAQTSKNSGGLFASYHDPTPIVDAIDMTRTTVEETRDIKLWNHLILLLIIIISLSFEWFIRKRRQLL
jgi:hypothetical protein